MVKSVVSTELARKIAESFGLVCFNTLTGFKWIAEKIQQFQEKGDHTFVFGFVTRMRAPVRALPMIAPL